MKSSKKFAKLISVILLVSMLLTSNSVGVWADSLEGTEPVSQTDLQENPNGEKTAENTVWESIGELASEETESASEETEFASEEAESVSEEAESVSEEAESESEEAESVSEEAESASEEAESDSEQDRQDAADNDGNENLEKDEQPDEDLPENLFPEDDVAEQEDENGKLPDVDPEEGEGTENKDPLPERSVRTNYNAIASNAAVQVWADFDSAEAVPDSAVLTVNEVTAGATYNYAAYMEALGNPENTHLYDLAFLTEETDENGNTTGRSLECQPSVGSVRVTMAFPADSLTESVQVTHLPLTAEVRASVLKTADAVSITAGQIHPEAVRDLKVNAAGGTIAFTVDSFSVYAVTVRDEGNQGAENNPGNSGDEGIVEFTEDPVEISADQVMVTAADEALIRQAAEALGLENTDAVQEDLPVPGLWQVKGAEAPLPSDEEKPHSTEALGLENTDAVQEDLPVPGLWQVKGAEAPLPSDEEKPHSTRSGYVGLDISVDKSLLSEGTLYKVPVTLPDPIDLTGAENAIIDSLTVTVYHIVDRTAEEVECVCPDDVKETGILSELFILTDGFSPYIVSYTVEFHNGDAEVVIEGGTQILLSTLITKLGLTRDDGSSFTADDIESVEFITSGLFTVEEVTGGGAEVVLNRGTKQEETVTVKTGHDFILSSQKPFDEVQMKLIFKDGTTLEVHVTDAQDALIVNVSLYDYDDTTAIDFPSNFGGDENVYMFVWDDSSGQDIKDLPEGTPWACVDITGVKGGNSPYSVNVDSFNTDQWGGGNPTPYSELTDDQKNNLKVRVIHTDGSAPTLGILKNMAQWQKPEFEKLWNGGFDGYAMSQKHDSGLISPGNYEVNFIKGNTLEHDVVLEFVPESDKGAVSGYYVLLDATSADGNNHYYYVVEAVTDGSSGKVLLPIKGNWSSGQPYSDNWKNIKASVITPKAGKTIQTGGVVPNSDDYTSSYMIGDYLYSYDGEQEEIDEDHTQHKEFILILKKGNFDPAIDPYDVLGEGAEYGVIADEYERKDHTETNFAVNRYNENTAAGIDLAANSGEAEAMPFYIGEYTSRIHFTGNVTVNPDIHTPSSRTGTYVHKKDNSEENEDKIHQDGQDYDVTVIPTSKADVEAYVNGLIGKLTSSSTSYAHKETQIKALPGKVLDTTSLPDNVTIYVDAADLRIDETGWEIKKLEGQSIVLNIPRETVNISKEYVSVYRKNEDGSLTPVVEGLDSNTSGNGGASDHNNAVENYILNHVVFNAYEARNVKFSNGPAGLFLAPNADFEEVNGSGTGWVATGQKFTQTSAEWHFFRTQRKYKSQGDFSLSGTKKILKNGAEANYSEFSSLTFTFDLFACDENGTVAENAMPLDTVTADSSGNFDFSKLSYTQADVSEGQSSTFHYVIRERVPEGGKAGGVSYDAAPVIVKVVATDGGQGTISFVISTSNDGGSNWTQINPATTEGSIPVYDIGDFTNTYTSSSTSVNFGGTKTFTGYPEGATPPTFTYTMSENGSVIDTQTTRGAGEYKFKSISYDTVGPHTYTVEESVGNAKGVTYDTKTYTVKVDVTDDGSGTLKATVTGDNPAALDFTNTYKADSTSVQFEGLKTLTGKELKDAEFSFTLTGSDGTDETVRNDGEGKIVFSKITYEKAGTYTYTVSENATDEAGVTIDSTTYNITVTVTDDGSGKLAAEVTGANEKGLNFTNTYKAGSTSVNFGGTKTFTGYPEGATPPTFTYTMSENGSVIDTQTTRGAGEYKFKSISYDTVGPHTYTVEESVGNAKGVTYDTKTYTVKVDVTDDGSGTLKATVTGDNPAALDFTNSYKADSTSVQFEGLKTLTGKELKNAEFSFTLKGDDGTDETVRNDGEGKIRFSEIKYEKPGTYTYTVRENATDEAGVTIDSKVYNITVEVTDDGSGKLAAEVTGANEKGLNFTNTYKAGSTSVNFGGTKTFTGYPEGATPPTFTYTMSENGSVIDTQTTRGAGEYKFKSISYDTVGPHTYTVEESVGNAKGVTYDTKTYTVKVDVTDDGSGTLKATVTGDDPVALDFTNSYKADSTSVQFEGMKTLTGKQLQNAEFSFTLTGSGNVNETVTNDGEGKIRFSEIKYEKPGTYTYTVRENATDEAGVTIDSKVYNITVEVTDDGSGKLAAEVTGANEKGLNFANQYLTGDLIITKRVTGDLGNRNQTFAFTIRLNCEGEFEYDGDVTGTISDGGTIRLKHGQSVTIKGLPAGCEYTVTESGNTGYRVYSTGAVGVIEDKATAIAAFTNSRSRVPATGESNWMLTGLAMVLSSAAGMFGIGRAKKRRKNQDQVK